MFDAVCLCTLEQPSGCSGIDVARMDVFGSTSHQHREGVVADAGEGVDHRFAAQVEVPHPVTFRHVP